MSKKNVIYDQNGFTWIVLKGKYNQNPVKMSLLTQAQKDLVLTKSWHGFEANGDPTKIYAKSTIECSKNPSGKTTIYLHAFLADNIYHIFPKPDYSKDESWDHKNVDPLDNTLDNIRVGTRQVQNHNRNRQKNATHRYRNIQYHKGLKKPWGPRIGWQGKRLNFPYQNTDTAAGLISETVERLLWKDQDIKYQFPLNLSDMCIPQVKEWLIPKGLLI